MEKNYSIEEIRKLYGTNKYIPKKYEREILTVLSQYPELKSTAIDFVLSINASVPYGTKPSFLSCFRKKEKRTYTITILEHAKEPMAEVLFNKLTENMRLGVIAHELAHVNQYNNCSPFKLLSTLARYLTPTFKRYLERSADKAAIAHGFGEQLLEHALYIRSVPGYIEQRPELNKYYLLPSEIRYYIHHPEEITAA